jgi:hypothetical protein
LASYSAASALRSKDSQSEPLTPKDATPALAVRYHEPQAQRALGLLDRAHELSRALSALAGRITSFGALRLAAE